MARMEKDGVSDVVEGVSSMAFVPDEEGKFPVTVVVSPPPMLRYRTIQ